MFRISNNLIGLLIFLTFLLSIPILTGGKWLSACSTTDCDKFLDRLIIAVNDSENWSKIKSCLADSNVCKKLGASNDAETEFYQRNLSPVQATHFSEFLFCFSFFHVCGSGCFFFLYCFRLR
ncbi:hypothetical protein MRB53_022687 [Persea americana]|uniref:Uncharacterized protein n=1 Tax=Persea americana TaxID=3435 RepID=A0ACC2L7D7_PERAE|nr:hypothetical protein MRB53_022687 [Persea americana]